MAKERDVGMGLEVTGGDDVEWFGLQQGKLSQHGHDAGDTIRSYLVDALKHDSHSSKIANCVV